MNRHSRFSPPPRPFGRARSPPPRRLFEDDFVRERRFQDNPLPVRVGRDHEVEPEFHRMRPQRRRSVDFGMAETEEDDGVLYFTDCVMFPPRAGIDKPVRPRTAKPPGCKTIFIGQLPESLVRIPKRLDAILSEVFTANGGEIDNVRISGRGFCHIRFLKEESVDRAMLLGGYWMEVKQGYEGSSKFRIMLDFAESSLDSEEYDTKNLIAIRLNMLPDEIPDVPSFNSFEMDKLAGDLKNPETYIDSVIILRYWINTKLNKQTSVRFFNVLQVTSVQTKRLQAEKKELSDEYNIMMERYDKNVAKLDKEFDHLLSLYEDAKKKKAWDNFSKPQRKSIENWFDIVRNCMSKKEKEDEKAGANANAKNVKKESAEQSDDEKTAKINSLQESLNAMQKQVWDMVSKLHNKELELQDKQQQIDAMTDPSLPLKTYAAAVPPKRKRTEDDNGPSFDAKSVKIMCALSSFLSAFPKGVAIESIEAYLAREFGISIKRDDLEMQLLQMSDVFTKQLAVEDGKTVMKWRYVLMASS